MEQGRFGGGLGVVVLLVLAGADDPAFLIPLHVHLALLPAPAEGAGGELLNESFVMTAEALEDRDCVPGLVRDCESACWGRLTGE